MTDHDPDALSLAILSALRIDVESAAIMADAMGRVMALALKHGIPERVALANACAQAIVEIAGNTHDMERVQYAASLVALCVDARLDYARVVGGGAVGFTASAAGKERAS